MVSAATAAGADWTIVSADVTNAALSSADVVLRA
jgi:hypothetical protein